MKSILKTKSSQETKSGSKRPSLVEDDDDDDDDDDEDDDDDDDDNNEEMLSSPPKSASKQSSSTATPPSKQNPTPTTSKSESTPSATQNKQKSASETIKQENSNKPLDKLRLYINSIKESITVSDMKALYPKAKFVKMQKRKVGPNHKIMQLAFITFDNESDCANALKAYTTIGGEKVNVSYAYGKLDKQVKPTVTDSKKNSEEKKKQPTPTDNNTNKTQQAKP
ncbi:unnamed protein product, partial [Rotaria magnacalcarata]